MSLWDGQARLSRVLGGPNLVSNCSGALITLALSPELAAWLNGLPHQEEREIWEHSCEAVIGRVARVSTPRHTHDNARWVHHLLALNDALRTHYCIDSSPAQLIELSSRRLLVFVPCDDAQLGLRVTALSAALLFDLLAAAPVESRLRLMEPLPNLWCSRWRAQVRAWREWAETVALNLNARWIAREAVRRGLPLYRPPGSKSLLQLGQGIHQRRLNGGLTDAVNSVGFSWSQDNWQTRELFAAHGLPTTRAHLVDTAEQAVAEARKMGWPVVIKPRSPSNGTGVTVNVQDEPSLRRAFDVAAAFRAGVLLERQVPGEDHRLLVVGGRFVAAARCRPAQIRGDGKYTVAELVEALNLSRFQSRAPGVYLPLVHIELDAEALRMLSAAGYHPEDVPPAGVVLPLRGHATLSAGGFAEDITPRVHPDNRKLAEQAARLMALTTAGIDLQTTDISRSWREVGGAVLEINAEPALWVHEPRTPDYDLPKAVLDDLFPASTSGRVLTAGITGSVGKTTTSQMLAHILMHDGHTVALTGTQGAFIDQQRLRTGDLAGGRTALSLLQDPAVTASVAELARGGLIKSGLGFDSLDVGAVLNVLDNHVGLNGVQNRAQMAQVKQLVVRHASKLAILNADDPLCMAMSEGMDTARVCFVSEAAGPQLANHIAAGGLVATMRENTQGPLLSLQQGESILGELPMAAIPATWGAKFRPAMINALFASAMAYGLGVSFPKIAQALTGFASDYHGNPGRMNRISGLPFELWLTCADGPRALEEIGAFIAGRGGSGSKSLLFFVAGNRPDDFIRASAQSVAGRFDRYYCTDLDHDRRGRSEGEVTAMLADTLLESGVAEASVVSEPSTKQAVLDALRDTPEGGVLAISIYPPEMAMEIIRSFWPEAL